eukprot:467444_1
MAQYQSLEENEIKYNDSIIVKKIRTPENIGIYLQHFLPSNLSLSNTSSCVMTLSSMTLNIYFILHNFILLNTNNLPQNHENDVRYLWLGNIAIIWIEAVGLFILLFSIIISLICDNKCMVIDCTKYCASWSSFQLFYSFNPKTLFNEYLICYSHHKSRLNTTNIEKYKQFKFLKNNILKEMKYNENKNHCNAMQQTVKKLETIIADFDNSSDFNKIYNETEYSKMTRAASWIIFVLITIALLAVGMMSLIGKLSQFSYINNTNITNWSSTQYITFIAFCNQLWNICDIESIKINTLHRFIFMKQNAKFTRYISSKVSMMDAVIKETLWNTFGIKGILVALSMDSNFLHKLIVQDQFDDFTINELNDYKKKIKQSNINKSDSMFDENRIDDILLGQKMKHDVDLQIKQEFLSVINNNDSNQRKEHGIWQRTSEKFKNTINNISNCLKLKKLQVPLIPYLEAESLIIRYKEKCSLNANMKSNNISINYFKNLPLLFEGIESIINRIALPIILLPFISTFIFAILSLIFQSGDWTINQQKCSGSHYNLYPPFFIIMMVAGVIFLIFVRFGICIKGTMSHWLFLSVAGIIIVNIVPICVLLSCLLRNPDGSITNIIHNGSHIYFLLFLSSVAACSVSVAMLFIIFILSYPYQFSILFGALLVGLHGLTSMLILPVILSLEIYEILDLMLTSNSDSIWIILTTLHVVILVLYCIGSIIHYCRRKIKKGTHTGDWVFFGVVFALYLVHIGYLVIYYSIDTFRNHDMMMNAWFVSAMFGFMWIYVIINGIQSIYLCNWIEYWILAKQFFQNVETH